MNENNIKINNCNASLANRISNAAFLFSVSAFCLLFFLALMHWGSSLMAVTISLVIAVILLFVNIKNIEQTLQSPKTNTFLIFAFIVIIIFGLMGFYGGEDGGFLWGLTTSGGSLFSIICCPFISIYCFCRAVTMLGSNNSESIKHNSNQQ